MSGICIPQGKQNFLLLPPWPVLKQFTLHELLKGILPEPHALLPGLDLIGESELKK